MKLKIQLPYLNKSLNFKSYPKFVCVPPFIYGVLKNMQTGTTETVTQRFKVDTGADISIVNSKCQHFLSTIKPIDYLDVEFGTGPIIKHMPVYELGLIISGYEIELTVLYYDKCPFLLLGHYRFFEYNTFNLFDSSSKKIETLQELQQKTPAL